MIYSILMSLRKGIPYGKEKNTKTQKEDHRPKDSCPAAILICPDLSMAGYDPSGRQLVHFYILWLSALVSKSQDMVSSCDSDQKPVKDGTTHFSAVESVAELTAIHLQMLGTGAVIGAVNKCLCIADHVMQPFEQLAIGIEDLVLVKVTLRQRFAVGIETICLDDGTVGNSASGEILNGNALDIGCQLHPQVDRMSLLILGNGNKNRLISSGSATLSGIISFFTCAKVRIVTLYDTTQDVMLIPHLHGSADPAKHIPGSFVANFNLTGQRQGRDAALVTGNQIDCPEPFGQGQVGAVHDGIGCQRGLMMAVCALILSAVLEGVSVATAADRTLKTIGPFDCVEIFHTRLLIREAFNKLRETQHLFLGHFQHHPLVPVYMIKCPIKRAKLQHLVSC